MSLNECPEITSGGKLRPKVVLIVAICLVTFGAIFEFAVGNPVFGAIFAVGVVIGGIKLAITDTSHVGELPGESGFFVRAKVDGNVTTHPITIDVK